MWFSLTDVATTVLERAIVAVQKGHLHFQTVGWTFAASDLYVPARTPPTGPALDSVEPLLVSSGEDLQLLALFATPDRAANFEPSYRYLHVHLGFDILTSLPPDIGVVLNPGSNIGFEMQAAGVARLKDELAEA